VQSNLNPKDSQNPDIKIPLFKRGSLRYLILILTWRCNLSCSYCYNGEKRDYDMPLEILERAFALLDHDDPSPFHIQLTGGEPALVPKLMDRAGELFSKIIKTSGRTGTLAVQSNGTLINEEIVALIKRHKMEVGLSLDGVPEINERLRGGTKALLDGIGLLSESSIPINITTVVSSENVSRLPELPLFLSSFPTIRAFGLDLMVKSGFGNSPPDPILLHDAALKIRENLTLVNKLRPRPLIFRELELVKNAKNSREGFFCEAHCGRSLAISPEGELYPCGQAAKDPDFSSGTVFDYIDPKKTFSGFTLSGEHCKTCPILGNCPGECPSRLHYNKQNPHLICELYRGLSGF
jgi:uncharacterized protein